MGLKNCTQASILVALGLGLSQILEESDLDFGDYGQALPTIIQQHFLYIIRNVRTSFTTENEPPRLQTLHSVRVCLKHLQETVVLSLCDIASKWNFVCHDESAMIKSKDHYLFDPNWRSSKCFGFGDLEMFWNVQNIKIFWRFGTFTFVRLRFQYLFKVFCPRFFNRNNSCSYLVFILKPLFQQCCSILSFLLLFITYARGVQTFFTTGHIQKNTPKCGPVTKLKERNIVLIPHVVMLAYQYL